MEHALLNDESESGQELWGWQEGCLGWGQGWGGTWKARVETRAGFLKKAGGFTGSAEGGARRASGPTCTGLTRPLLSTSALQGF